MFIPFLGARDHRQVARRERARGGARRPRRARSSARVGAGVVPGDRRGDEQRPASARSPTSASSSTSSTCCRSCRSTAAARWRRWRRGCGSSASARWSRWCSSSRNPILLIIVVFGGLETWRRWKQRKTRSLEQAAYYRVSPRNRAARRRRLPRPDRRCSRSAWTQRTSSAPPATASARSEPRSRRLAQRRASRTARSMSRLVSRSRIDWRLS